MPTVGERLELEGNARRVPVDASEHVRRARACGDDIDVRARRTHDVALHSGYTKAAFERRCARGDVARVDDTRAFLPGEREDALTTDHRRQDLAFELFVIAAGESFGSEYRGWGERFRRQCARQAFRNDGRVTQPQPHTAVLLRN